MKRKSTMIQDNKGMLSRVNRRKFIVITMKPQNKIKRTENYANNSLRIKM